MNNCHLWILKIYPVDICNIHYPWYIDGIRKIYAKIYAIVYYVCCTVVEPNVSSYVQEDIHVRNTAMSHVSVMSVSKTLKLELILNSLQFLILHVFIFILETCRQ